MKLVVQRVTDAKVTVEDETVGEIGKGFMVLVGFGEEDDLSLPDSKVWQKALDKLMNLRIFPDDRKPMNQSLADINGDLLLVSQFTLYADCKKGRRPSFGCACAPDIAEELMIRFVEDASKIAPAKVARGRFGADMRVTFTNWGPVTIILDTAEL